MRISGGVLPMVLALALGCGSGDDGPSAGSGGGQDGPASAAGSSQGPNPEIDYRARLDGLPDDVRAQLEQLIDAIAPDLCAFSQTCCGHFGFDPRTDCQRQAEELVLRTPLAEIAASGRAVGFDSARAATCMEQVRDFDPQCVFPRERPDFVAPCRYVAYLDGTPYDDCLHDEDCLVSGDGCAQGICKPLRVLGLGEVCDPTPDAPDIPRCGPEGRCKSVPGEQGLSCVPRLGQDESCVQSADCLPDLYCDARVCTPRVSEGATCELDDACEAGLRCGYALGGAGVTGTCEQVRHPGAPCERHTQCAGFLQDACVDGICMASNFELLHCRQPTVDDLPGDLRLTALDPGQLATLCDWATAIFDAEVQCQGQSVVTGCMTPSSSECRGTVAQYRACLPDFAAALDACRLLDPSYVSEVRAILDSLPSCRGLAPCLEVR